MNDRVFLVRQSPESNYGSSHGSSQPNVIHLLGLLVPFQGHDNLVLFLLQGRSLFPFRLTKKCTKRLPSSSNSLLSRGYGELGRIASIQVQLHRKCRNLRRGKLAVRTEGTKKITAIRANPAEVVEKLVIRRRSGAFDKRNQFSRHLGGELGAVDQRWRRVDCRFCVECNCPFLNNGGR